MSFMVREIASGAHAVEAEINARPPYKLDAAEMRPLLLKVQAHGDTRWHEVCDIVTASGMIMSAAENTLLLSGTVYNCCQLISLLHCRQMPELAAAIQSALDVRRTVHLNARGRTLPLGERTLVMGIINVSPDSFSRDGLADAGAAVEQARRFLEAGAEILDVGAMSTRPRSQPVSEELEARRLSETIGALRALTDVPVSADTYRVGPARAALEAGADIINDISGLRDPRMAPLVAEYDAGVVVMHMLGTPDTMQQDPRYEDVVGEVYEYLAAAAGRAEAAGVRREGIVLDPGIGFGKTVGHNLELLRRLREFTGLGLPLLVGTSRKSFIGRVTGRDVGDRIEGTAATVALSIANGADIVRVHDVEQMVAVARMSDAIVRGATSVGAQVAR